MRISVLRSVTLAALVLAPCWGCGSVAGITDTVTVPVKGKVTYKGKLLTKGRIEFEPVDSGRTSSGAIQADGSFVLSTTKEGDGASPGRNMVSVHGTGATTKKELVAAKFTSPNRSGVEVEVSRGQTEYSIELK